MSRRTANALCLLVAMIWGMGFLATQAALQTFDAWLVLAIRFIGSAAISWLALWILKKKVSRLALRKGFVCSIFLYLSFAFQTFGLVYTDTGSNAFLTAVYVVLVPYISWLCFHHRPALRQFAACFLCLTGTAMLCLSKGLSLNLGDLLTLVCALFFAMHIVALEWATRDEDVMVINTLQMSGAALFSIVPACLLSSWPASISGSAILSCLYMIAISTWLAFFLQTLAQKYTSASEASLLLCTESLWANLFGWLILHEEKSWLMLLGGALIMISVFLSEYQPEQKEIELEKTE